MWKQEWQELKPVVSIVVIIFTLFGLVFFKMEIRRLGYSVLKQSRSYRSLQDDYRKRVIDYARLTSPDQLRRVAVSKFTMSEAKVGQVIHMSGTNIALKQ